MGPSTVIGSNRVTADPLDALLHYAVGEIPCFVSDDCAAVGWVKHAHRGVHLLGEISIPRSQRRYVFSDRFEFKVDGAFDDVLRACADPANHGGFTWITPELEGAYRALHRLGFAHSYEAWADGELAGGCFGVHVGAYASVDSMFHRVSNASKAAYGRALHLLKARGFALVDSNPVEDSSRNYGEEWVPQWRFEELLRVAVGRVASVADDAPARPLPWQVRQALPVARLARKVMTTLRRRGVRPPGGGGDGAKNGGLDGRPSGDGAWGDKRGE